MKAERIFIGLFIILVSFLVYSQFKALKTNERIYKLNRYNDSIQIRVDSLKQRADRLYKELKLTSLEYKNYKEEKQNELHLLAKKLKKYEDQINDYNNKPFTDRFVIFSNNLSYKEN